MGGDVANEQNLIPNSERTPSERRENASKAGKASGASRRRKRDARKIMEAVLKSVPPMDKQTKANLDKLGIQGTGKNKDKYDLELIATAALMQKAMRGDVKAYRLILEIMGEDARSRAAADRLELERELASGVSADLEPVNDGFIEAMQDAAGDVFDDEEDQPDHIE